MSNKATFWHCAGPRRLAYIRIFHIALLFLLQKSSAEHGTLYQLKKTKVVPKPLDNFNECDDFFVLIVKCHVLTDAMKIL